MNAINWTSHARRQLKKVSAEMRQIINNAVKKLAATWPDSSSVTRLVDREEYRLRVRDYRVIFVVEPDGHVVILHILEVRKRNERTYQ
ncbi:cytotoxic translational repressor of toxin-antitoxin stability system [Deltaproteobacteria bacterium Smac51]|nr:cytotoxic translational repressor of toxin-antitoxin stability system [Deltaproteobacteria bacterium Smac51]